ncbi:MAG: FAD-dependent oxidoreductase [Caulobacter sp.]|nr:FAD-dependent oxidoreductase [Caulobacter sp.]
MHYDIVIVGGGAGGLELAAKLGRKLGRKRGTEKVLLIDRTVFHIWKPTLHEVAAGTLDTHQEGLSYPILARRNHFSFTLGEMSGLDPAARRLTLAAMRGEDGRELAPERSVTFTWCVLALGGGANLFGTPGAERAYLLENTGDAIRFHNHLLAAFTRASFAPERSLAVAIVGGGATGVELSAELIEAHNELDQGLAKDQRFRLDITIVEAADRILGQLPEKISAQATVALERKGVTVKTGARVVEVAEGRVATSLGDIPADIIVWAAGVKAADSNTGLGLETNRLNQIVVNARLETSADGIWALGDCAAAPWKDGRTVPARAQAAHQQADYLARVLGARLAERRYEAPFQYRDFGSLVSLGESRGVGSLMGGLGGPNFFIEGLVAKWLYMSLHLNHHRAILGSIKTVVLALARLLQERVSGRLKLH